MTGAPRCLTLDAAGVATLLGRPTEWFYRNREALEAEGFPRRLPVVRLWERAAVEAWLARQRPPELQPAELRTPAQPTPDNSDSVRDKLRERAARLAGGL